jgi:antitoxin (DNA-binding transcriptional repressor) of toxin-antitoxin stability system
MATIVTVHEAKTKLSELLRRVEAGEEIIIARGDKSVATLKAVAAAEDIEQRRKAGKGCLAGKFLSPSDNALFGPMSEEDLAAWYDGPIFPDETRKGSKKRKKLAKGKA